MYSLICAGFAVVFGVKAYNCHREDREFDYSWKMRTFTVWFSVLSIVFLVTALVSLWK